MGRRILGVALWLVGVLLVVFGAIWTLQGLGILMWPAESFMLAERKWAINGAALAVVGVALVWVSRRR